ncbi:MAG: DegV family protein [Solobacterium sp.]|nr:DegV family protein [Solobacterium sp.]
MNDFILATVSTSDLPRKWLDEHNIPFLPYTFVIDETIYEDDCREETRQRVFEAMRAGKIPSTSQIPEFTYEEFFRSLLDSGKDVLFLDMARAISSSINNCEEAIRRVAKDYPEQRLVFLDSFCITGGLAILIEKMTALKESGASLDEVYAFGEDLKDKIIHRFMCDDLQWLRRGGRLSNASAIVGTLLSIKPLIYVRHDGTLFALEKVRGRKKALHRLVDSMQEEMDPDHLPEEMWIWHADCAEDAQDMAAYMKEKYPTVKEVHIHTEGPVIGTHVGPGFFAVLFIGKGRIM